jgi:hypothetical protein
MNLILILNFKRILIRLFYLKIKTYKYGKFVEFSIISISNSNKFCKAIFDMSIIDNRLKYLQIFLYKITDKRTKFSKKGE